MDDLVFGLRGKARFDEADEDEDERTAGPESAQQEEK